MADVKKTAAWLSICIGCVASFEGLRTVAYTDPAGIPTVCFGETKDVRLGDSHTAEECRTLLRGRLEEFGGYVDSCVSVLLPPARKAALTSFTYNVGQQAFCTSTLVALLNEGRVYEACNQLLRWNKITKAGVKIVLPGLTTRRQVERLMCLEEWYETPTKEAIESRRDVFLGIYFKP